MKVYLIRHSLTGGNLKKRYIGRTDEPLCKEGVLLIKKRLAKEGYPKAERLYVSPRLRCVQTAGLLYPGQQPVALEALAECDFGLFENKSYEELSGCPQYQRWVDSKGTLPFPEGESMAAFSDRSVRGFARAVEACRRDGIASAVFVVHGGTIMSIMEKYAVPKSGFYDYQIGNGEGYELVIADAHTGNAGISSGFASGGPGMAVSSGALHRASDYGGGKNYKRLFSEDESR